MIRWLIGSPLALPAALVARYPELREARWRRGGLAVRVGGWGLRLLVAAAAIECSLGLACGRGQGWASR